MARRVRRLAKNRLQNGVDLAADSLDRPVR
jgi:hypothetical protein